MGGAAPRRAPPRGHPQSRAARLLSPADTARLDPEIGAILEGLLALGDTPAHEVPVEQARAGHENEARELSGPGEEVAEVRDVAVESAHGPIPVRVYRPQGDGPLPLIAYVHGGGWILGSIDSFDTVVRSLANAAGAVVASIGYRLAPEHPFPAGLEDCACALRWLHAHAGELGADPERMAIAGDSAGGNLGTVVARRLRDDVPLRMQALIYPATDAGCNTSSYGAFGAEHGITAATMQRSWNLYLGGADGLDPDASPLRSGDLGGSPPALVLTAEFDPLRDEGEAYAAALRDAGVPVEIRRVPGTVHGFWRWLAAAEVSRRTVAEVGAALRQALA
jgi:acetyl esterase